MATTCGGPSVGVFTRFLIEPGASPYTWDSSSERYEVLAENFQRHGRLIGGQGITGKIYRLKSRVRQGGYYCYGQFTLNPSVGYFNTLLPYLVGTEGAGDTFTPGNCLNVFGALPWRDDDNDKAWEYKDGVVAGWELEARSPEFREQGAPDLLALTVHCIFKDETPPNAGSPVAWPSSEPSLPTGADYYPYIFQDCSGAVTLQSAVRSIYAMKLECWNRLKPRYSNSLTLSSILYAGKTVRLGLVLPYDATNDDLYNQSYVGAAASIRFTLGTAYTQFNLTNLKVPPESPYTKDEFEIYFENNGESYGDEATDTPEITVKNVLTT